MKEFIESFSEKSILGKVVDDLRDYRKNNKGLNAKEVQFNAKGFEQLQNCNLFKKHPYSLIQLNEKGFFTLLDVKCIIVPSNKEEYKIISNPTDNVMVV